MRRRRWATLLGVGVAEKCSDELLWVDGTLATCASSALDCTEWFCPDCRYAAACDAYCGYCVPSRDCRGQECLSEERGYTSCEDWVGDGCCDDGFGHRSDAGDAIDLKCKDFAYDGGDCERASTTPVIVPETESEWCLLLTATICPSQGMTHTVRRSPNIRRQDYVDAISQWAEATTLPVIVVENSGSNLTALRTAAKHARGYFEFLSFHAAPDTSKGKGFAEYQAIQFAMRSSAILSKSPSACKRIVKITGRYFLRHFDDVLNNLAPRQPRVVVQSTPSPWSLEDGVLRSEVVAFQNDPSLVDLLFANQDEAIGLPMERSLFLAVRYLMDEGHISTFPPLDVLPPTLNAEHKVLISTL